MADDTKSTALSSVGQYATPTAAVLALIGVLVNSVVDLNGDTQDRITVLEHKVLTIELLCDCASQATDSAAVVHDYGECVDG